MSEEPIIPTPEHHNGLKEAMAKAALIGAGIAATMGIGGTAHADEGMPSTQPTAASQEASPASDEATTEEESPTPEPVVSEAPSDEPSPAPSEETPTEDPSPEPTPIDTPDGDTLDEIGTVNPTEGDSGSGAVVASPPPTYVVTQNTPVLPKPTFEKEKPKELPPTGAPTDILPLAGLGTTLVIAGGLAAAAGRKPEEEAPKA